MYLVKKKSTSVKDWCIFYYFGSCDNAIPYCDFLQWSVILEKRSKIQNEVMWGNSGSLDGELKQKYLHLFCRLNNIIFFNFENEIIIDEVTALQSQHVSDVPCWLWNGVTALIMCLIFKIKKMVFLYFPIYETNLNK